MKYLSIISLAAIFAGVTVQALPVEADSVVGHEVSQDIAITLCLY
jgi:hypothetical protein